MAEFNDFVEAEGRIHLLNPIMSEFTLCGDAFDLNSDEPGYAWSAPTRRCVTCKLCAKVVMTCRGVTVVEI